jgi:hypothetical protein
MTPNADLERVIDKLRRYAWARDRWSDREPRIISITDDDAVVLLRMLPPQLPAEPIDLSPNDGSGTP